MAKKGNKSKQKVDLDWEKLYLSIKELGEKQKETDRIVKELARRQEEDRRQLEEFKKQVARITDSWGRFVEGMVEPAAIAYFRKKGFIPYEAYQRLKVSKNGRNTEYDLFLVAPEHKTAMLVSAKTHVSSRDINELEEDIKSLSFFLDRIKGYKVLGAIAGITFGRSADKFAQRKGFIILKVSEDNFEIIEPRKIKVFQI